jgi:PmbA/TldA metallopeptidase C-terminal domain
LPKRGWATIESPQEAEFFYAEVVLDVRLDKKEWATQRRPMGAKGGVILHPVTEVNISGNHLDFWNKLVALGSDVLKYSSNYNPNMMFEDVSCSGS